MGLGHAMDMHTACRTLLSLGKCWLYMGSASDRRQDAVVLTVAPKSEGSLNFVLYRASGVAFYALTAPWNVENMMQDRVTYREI